LIERVLFELPKKIKREEERFDFYEKTQTSNKKDRDRDLYRDKSRDKSRDRGDKNISRTSSFIDGQVYTSMITRENLKTNDLRDTNTPNRDRTPRTYVDRDRERLDTDQKDISGFYFGNTSEINFHNEKQNVSSTSFTQLRNKTTNSTIPKKTDTSNGKEILSKVLEPNKINNIFQNSNSGFYNANTNKKSKLLT